MSITCPKCDNSIMLQGPVRKAHCNSCQNDTNIPVKYWKENLYDALEWIVSDLKESEGHNLMQFGLFNTKWSVHELAPRCRNCNKKLEIKNVDGNKESKIKCSKCGVKNDIAPVPGWLKYKLPAADFFVNAQMHDELEDNEPAISGGIALTCSKCGGALIVDGKDRLVPCKYCDVHVYLPDDLWLRLHPVEVKSRWFLVYDKKEVEKIDFDAHWE